MNIRILIVEDEDVIGDLLEGAIKNRLAAHAPSVERCKSIPTSGEALQEFRPHIVTLDLKDETSHDIAAGKPAWDYISNRHFCPVVFFSANDLPPGFPDGNDPFAPFLSKHDKNPEDVAIKVETFLPYVLGLEQIRADVESRYAQSLQKVSRLIWSSEKEEKARAEALIRITRRRLAATLEHPLGEEVSIKAWEQFIFPPIDGTLCTGDILQRIGGGGQAEDFRVILSPPCDLVVGANRHPVAEVLCGKCVPVRHADVLRKTSRKALKENGQPNTELPTQLGKSLSGDKLDGMVVIPKLEGVFPAMVLDLKSFEMIERVKIAVSQEAVAAGSVYVRLAGMDSPFREALSWRFTHSVGRPGYPVMDEVSLAKDVEEEAKKG